MPINSDISRVTLKNPDDYHDWLKAVRTHAITGAIWHVFNPATMTLPRVEPLRPPPNSLEVFRDAQGNVPASIINLTAAQRGVWALITDQRKQDLEDWKAENDKYRQEKASIKDMVSYIQDSVDRFIYSSCCSDDNYGQWIQRISLQVGIDDREATLRARKEYEQALTGVRKNTQWDNWLTEYNRAATKAEEMGCIEVLNMDAMLERFTQAIKPFDASFNSAFEMEVLRTPTMTRQEAMKLFRTHMERNFPVKHTKSAFAAGVSNQREVDAFHTDDSSAPQKITTGGTPSQLPKGAGSSARGRGNKRKGYPRLDSSSKCPACHMKHTLTECFYAYPEKAPGWFHPNEGLTELVRMKIEHDPVLQDEMRGTKRGRSTSSKSTGNTRIKTSQAPIPQIEEIED
jgi:hypothetical protein